jgi:hypothetical protein
MGGIKKLIVNSLCGLKYHLENYSHSEKEVQTSGKWKII